MDRVRLPAKDCRPGRAGFRDLEGHSAYRPGRFSLAITGPGLSASTMLSSPLLQAPACPATPRTGRQTAQNGAGAS
jgi:hypothetical protein